MKNIFLTGGAGFIGSHFAHHLLEQQEEILLVNLDALTYAGSLDNLRDIEDDPRHLFVRGDICDRELVSDLFRRTDFDCVIHFAAESHVDRSIAGPDAFVRTNVTGTTTLLQAAKEAWYDARGAVWKPGVKFVQISTDEVYGSLGAKGAFTEDSSLSPRNPYSASKAAADHFVQAFCSTYGMPVNIVRGCNNFGPRQYPEKLIPLAIQNALQHKPIPVYGDGQQIRDWLYVEDFCRAIELVAERGEPGEVYNVSGGNERSNIEIIKTILALLREERQDDAISESLIEHVTDRPGHDRRYAMDASKIQRDLGWQPEISLEDGLRMLIGDGSFDPLL